MSLQFDAIASIVTGLVEGARLVSSRLPKKESREAGPDSAAELDSRVSAIESHATEQDRLIQALAEQLENLAAASEELNGRVRILLWVSGAALLVGLAGLLVALLS